MSAQETVAAEMPGDARHAVVDPVVIEPEVSTRSMSVGRRMRSPQTLISFALAFAFIFVVFRKLNINFSDVWSNIRNANPWFLLLSFLVYYASFPVRAARWTRLLANAKISREEGYDVPGIVGMSEIYILSWFANCIAPAKLGDAYRGYLLKKNSGASFTRSLGTIFAERLLDVVALGILLVVSGLVAFHGTVPENLRWWFIAGIVLAALGVVGVLGLALFGHGIGRLVPARARPHYERLQEGLVTSFARGHTVGIVVTTAAIWLMEGIRVWAVAHALHVGLSAEASIFVALLASLLTTFPVTPAGLGAVESGSIVALGALGIAKGEAASIAVVDRLVAYWSVILIGGALYLASKRK